MHANWPFHDLCTSFVPALRPSSPSSLLATHSLSSVSTPVLSFRGGADAELAPPASVSSGIDATAMRCVSLSSFWKANDLWPPVLSSGTLKASWNRAFCGLEETLVVDSYEASILSDQSLKLDSLLTFAIPRWLHSIWKYFSKCTDHWNDSMEADTGIGRGALVSHAHAKDVHLLPFWTVVLSLHINRFPLHMSQV